MERRDDALEWAAMRVVGLTVAAGLAALLMGASAEAQQPKKIVRIGVVIPGSRATYSIRIEAFRNGLRELGYIGGQNIAIEYRSGEGIHGLG